jgi:hypothetical protein
MTWGAIDSWPAGDAIFRDDRASPIRLLVQQHGCFIRHLLFSSYAPQCSLRSSKGMHAGIATATKERKMENGMQRAHVRSISKRGVFLMPINQISIRNCHLSNDTLVQAMSER